MDDPIWAAYNVFQDDHLSQELVSMKLYPIWASYNVFQDDCLSQDLSRVRDPLTAEELKKYHCYL